MALTWFQRLQVAFRGWSRRREEETKRRDEDFLRRNVAWGKSEPVRAASPPAGMGPVTEPAPAGPVLLIDREGLQVAFLDDSGMIAYYLDTRGGDVIEARDAASRAEVEKSSRFKRVPCRSPQSEVEDRKAFIQSLDESRLRESLSMTTDAQDFRKMLATDRAAERAWYNFKNDRATNAIESWLRGLGLH